jgi:predicted site-specific integrase-resolvase
MTVPEILKEVGRVKRISRETLYTYFRKFEIRPVSDVPQCPQHYPDDAAKKILLRLGLSPVQRTPKAPTITAKKLGKGRNR